MGCHCMRKTYAKQKQLFVHARSGITTHVDGATTMKRIAIEDENGEHEMEEDGEISEHSSN